MARQRGDGVWMSLLAFNTAVELYAVRQERKQDPDLVIPFPSLSRLIRRIGRADTKVGRVAIASSWVVFTAWFLPHLFKKDKS